MKIAALLSGILASAFAWAASYFLTDVRAEFLTLWPATNSQQFLGLVAWHCAVAAALIGGLITVFSPLLGGVVLLAAAGVWAGMGLVLPSGFSLQLIGPLVLSLIGAAAAFGALVRGTVRRKTREKRPSLEDEAREEALRIDPTDDLAQALKTQKEKRPDPLWDPPEVPRGEVASPEAIKVAPARRAEAGPPRGISGLFVANLAVLILLSGAVGLLLYNDLRSGQLANLATTLPASPAVAAAAAPAQIEPEQETDPAVVETASTPASAAISQPAPAPLQLTAAAGEQFDDPFAYCAAVRTIDFPDGRYTGPALTQVIADSLRVPATAPPDRARWRCYDGDLLGCTGFNGPRCAPTPTVTEMVDYCTRNPNATGLQAPNGTWSCNDTDPAIPAGASWPMDPRGFLPGAWVQITPPA